MRASILNVLTRPAAGPVASLVALALAGGLGGLAIHAARTEAGLKAQIARLTAENQQTAAIWQAKLTTCRAQVAAPAQTPVSAPSPMDGRITRVAGDDDAVASRLASVGPAGFDDCARMEAADAAVLGSLHAK